MQRRILETYLAPNLHEETDHGPVDHVRLEKLQVADIGVGTLEFNDFPYFGHFAVDEGRVGVTMAVDKSQNMLSFLPAILASEPPR